MTLAEMVDHITWILPIIIPLCILALALRYAEKITTMGEGDGNRND